MTICVYFLWRLEHFKQSFTNLPLVLWHINGSRSCKWTGLLTVDGRRGCFRDCGKKRFFVCCVVFVKLCSDGSAFTGDILHIQCERPRWRLTTRGCRRVWEKFPGDLFLQRGLKQTFFWTWSHLPAEPLSFTHEEESSTALKRERLASIPPALFPVHFLVILPILYDGIDAHFLSLNGFILL